MADLRSASSFYFWLLSANIFLAAFDVLMGWTWVAGFMAVFCMVVAWRRVHG